MHHLGKPRLYFSYIFWVMETMSNGVRSLDWVSSPACNLLHALATVLRLSFGAVKWGLRASSVFLPILNLSPFLHTQNTHCPLL